MKKIKLTETDLERIVRRVVMEQSVEMTNVPSKDIKPVISQSQVNNIKSQATVLSKDIELMKKSLELLRKIDPEAYNMITRGGDLNKRTPLGDAIIGGTIMSIIYTIVQELRGK